MYKKYNKTSYILLLPLEVNGIVNQDTLIAMDKALVDGWKYKEPDYKKAPWVKTAETQIGVSEYAGKHKENPQIREYYKAGKYLWATDDSGSVNAWCGCFVAWVMQKAGYSSVKNAFRAKSWMSYGKKIDEPVHGAIGIKSRKGGGHTAFIVGKSKDGKYYYMLGGNQSDQVNISKYKKEDWDMFVVPSKYDTTNAKLPIYSKQADKSSKES
ncbi:TIGR02594 family protein [Sulfurimonas sp.]|uniref:TIGR02594 family protein n=1 Tax=Sulfurimonas sp. TaxID=2022749 RepID=UPI0025E6DCB1|nr:TIGR02594 family protein [Sulfurimonas sp.]